MKMMQVLVAASLVMFADASAYKAGLRAAGHSGADRLATDVTDSKKDLDIATRREADKLLHLLAEDDKESKKAKEEKKKEKKMEKKDEEDLEFEVFLEGCLVHTAEMVQQIDRSYTDMQLKTVLENECSLSKEFPTIYDTGFEHHKACVDFASKLTDARFQELNTGSTKGYKEFCTKYYEHKVGKVPLKEVEEKPEVQKAAFGWAWRLWVLIICLAVFFCAIAACVFMKKRSPSNNRN